MRIAEWACLAPGYVHYQAVVVMTEMPRGSNDGVNEKSPRLDNDTRINMKDGSEQR